MTTKNEALALEALLDCARKAEALKKECGMDPESPQAIRNSQYMAISYTAHAAITAIKQAQQAQEPVKTIPDDFYSHKYAWLAALQIARDAAEVSPPDIDDKSYWEHEIKAFQRAYAELESAAPKQAEPAEKRKLYECTGCGHLHEEKPSSCDCCENHGNDYNGWTASPTPPEAKA